MTYSPAGEDEGAAGGDAEDKGAGNVIDDF